MKTSIRHKLEQLADRMDELDARLSSEGATNDMDQYRKLSREHAEIGPVVAVRNEGHRGRVRTARRQAALARLGACD